MERYPPIISNFPYLLHGGDYNPDQWLHMPEIIEEDFRLFGLAGVNSASVAIFAWAALEPEEGRFEFGWLDRILERMASQGMKAVLATPSGAKPNWLAWKYPEVRRVNREGQREPQQGRHNHCPTSPIYREKVAIINSRLGERYAKHPALGIWHISNEYGGECFCELCKDAFRRWLQRKYGTLESLNRAWWTAFWSHTYTEWKQIDALDGSIHGLILDWKRFVTDQTVDFMRHEIAALRRFTPNTPVTTNMMGFYEGLNYWKLAEALDVASWDNYPAYHGRANMPEIASSVSMAHDLNRSLKGGKPFLMMESTPSVTNWEAVAKLRRLGILRLTSLQAVAHGADSVQYFQWRKGRGGSEKFHGAVVDHVGHEDTRVFREVAEVGNILKRLARVVGATRRSEVALIVDWENRWALELAQGPRREGRDYLGECCRHYRPFWRRGISMAVVDQTADLTQYRLVIAPMSYMIRPGFAEGVAAFVQKGGILVTTYWSGIVDENDCCFLGGRPGPLRPLAGVWVEEIDALYDDEENIIIPEPENDVGLNGEYRARIFCERIHAEGAKVLARFGRDFYAGMPAVTVNTYGEGEVYYLAARAEESLLDDLYQDLLIALEIPRALDSDLPPGVTAQLRTDGERDYIFVLNFNAETCRVELGDTVYYDVLADAGVTGTLMLPAFGSTVLERAHQE